MVAISEQDQTYYALLVQQWNDLPPGELDVDTLPPELKAAWDAHAPMVASLWREGGPLTERQAFNFYMEDVILPLSHGLKHDPRVTDE